MFYSSLSPSTVSEPEPVAVERGKNPIVIIADDDAALVQALTIRLKQMGFDVFRSPDALHALLGAHRIRPDLMIVDINMPGGNGLSVCEMIASDANLTDLEVVVMSGETDEAIVERCKSFGAQYVRKGPQLWERLQQVVCRQLHLPPPAELLPAAEPQAQMIERAEQSAAELPPLPTARPRILSIDDDPDVTHVIKLRLERMGMEVLEAASGMQGFWKAVECRPQAIICDLNMPDGEGTYIYGRLTSHPITKAIPVIILTGLSNPALRRHLLGLGVAAFFQKPVAFDELLTELRKHVSLPSTKVST